MSGKEHTVIVVEASAVDTTHTTTVKNKFMSIFNRHPSNESGRRGAGEHFRLRIRLHINGFPWTHQSIWQLP